MPTLRPASLFLLSLLFTALSQAAEPIATTRGDRMIAEYFQAETARLAEQCLANDRTLHDWSEHRQEYRRQLLDMLGLDPLPQKTDLRATITGTVPHEEFVVEKLHFQSRPGLYVTANLYRPKVVKERLPAILYVCGHGQVKKDGISYGNKVTYQHHGAWFARNGYVCLTIDTLQMGEIEGIHHGTYRYGRWWWLNRGYTSAGVEAWNCLRALDYLETRPEVDPQRMGVTGRSGGGAYSWWIAATDDRVRCAVPVAGITDLENHVVDGCVEGHCDCMYMVNTYRWDYPLVAALVAPRPLLISNTDTDRIFPLDGVVRVFEKTRAIYALHDAADKVALNITAGPHKDTQELQVHAFRWLNHHLRGSDELVEKAAVKYFEPEQLRVFQELPQDQINTKVDETFVAAATPPPVEQTGESFAAMSSTLLQVLQKRCFAAWPEQPESLECEPAWAADEDGLSLRAYDFTSQGAVRLRLYLLQQSGLPTPELTVLNVLDNAGWTEFLASMRPAFEKQLSGESLPPANESEYRSTKEMLTSQKWAMAFVAPRGIGPTAWDSSEKKQVQHQRRFYLLGQTLDGMRVWDIRRAVQAIRSLDAYRQSPLWLQGKGSMGGNALYAALYEPQIARLDLHRLPSSHRDGPYYLNVQRELDMPVAVALAARNSRVVLYDTQEQDWHWPLQVAKNLGWDKTQLQIRN